MAARPFPAPPDRAGLPAPPVAALLLAATLAACSPPPSAPAPAAARAEGGGAAQGTVLAARPLGARGAAPQAGIAGEAEFTVRDDSGADLQVAQADAEGLRAGDRVAIARGDRTRLTRLAGTRPAAAPRASDAPEAERPE